MIKVNIGYFDVTRVTHSPNMVSMYLSDQDQMVRSTKRHFYETNEVRNYLGHGSFKLCEIGNIPRHH